MNMMGLLIRSKDWLGSMLGKQKSRQAGTLSPTAQDGAIFMHATTKLLYSFTNNHSHNVFFCRERVAGWIHLIMSSSPVPPGLPERLPFELLTRFLVILPNEPHTHARSVAGGSARRAPSLHLRWWGASTFDVVLGQRVGGSAGGAATSGQKATAVGSSAQLVSRGASSAGKQLGSMLKLVLVEAQQAGPCRLRSEEVIAPYLPVQGRGGVGAHAGPAARDGIFVFDGSFPCATDGLGLQNYLRDMVRRRRRDGMGRECKGMQGEGKEG